MRKRGGAWWCRFHKWAAILWASVGVALCLVFSDSVLWVGLMSAYANVVGHWGAYQGARAEDVNER